MRRNSHDISRAGAWIRWKCKTVAVSCLRSVARRMKVRKYAQITTWLKFTVDNSPAEPTVFVNRNNTAIASCPSN